MNKHKILVVEDEAIVAADIRDCLEHLGFEVCAITGRGEDAILKASEHKPQLVLMDIRLKGEVDGIEAAGRIRDELNIPVVYLTAHADQTTLERAKITEPYGYILKPFEEIELRIAIELALYKHQMERPAKTLPETTKPLKTTEPNTEAYEFLCQVKPFTNLDEASLHEFASACHIRQFSAGEPIAFEGDTGIDGFLVVSGRVGLVKTSSTGRELIVELLPAGDVFGLISSIDKSEYPYTARAQAASRLLRVPHSSLVRLVDKHPELYRDFIDVVSERLKRSHGFSRALAHDRVEVRIASALLALVPRFGQANSKDSSDISMTRQELADLTGATVETAIRVTKSFERDGLLDLARPGLIKILHPSQLEQVAEQQHHSR